MSQCTTSFSLNNNNNNKIKTIRPLLISESSMEQNYDKLVMHLCEKLTKESTEGKQYWIAIAGGPGSGKTTVANEIAKRINKLYSNNNKNKKEESTNEFCVVLPMDGFHYSKDELKTLDPPNGINYMKRRGAPWTMNASKCFQLLSQAKKDGYAELPTYSREISDPIPGGVTLFKYHKLVLVEGLYLLWDNDHNNDDDDGNTENKDWKDLQKLWDEKWFIKCQSREDQRERLIQRSLENWGETKIKTWGPGRQGAEAKVDANDALNMDIVAPSENNADVIIESI